MSPATRTSVATGRIERKTSPWVAVTAATSSGRTTNIRVRTTSARPKPASPMARSAIAKIARACAPASSGWADLPSGPASLAPATQHVSPIAPARAQPIARRHPGAGGRVGVRRPARRRIADAEPEPLGEGDGVLDEPARSFELLHRPPVGHRLELGGRVGNRQPAEQLADRRLGRLEVLAPHRPDVDPQRATFGHDVWPRPARA